ncbi:hypothetical protein [Amnibacterium endophyticum]|uniref:Uncharacterized protein n=1 Tax=Amnibacterium endophyticum TaxID=2109337 RepID=A0ABW4LFW0_9MICO
MFEIVLVLTGVLGGLLALGALIARGRLSVVAADARSAALARAQRGLLLRAAAAVVLALVVFLVLAIVTDRQPLLQGVLFAVAPALAMGTGLGAFALLPGAVIEGQVEVRSAQLERRTPLSMLGTSRLRLVVGAFLAAGLLLLVCGLLSKSPVGDGRLICTSLFTAACSAGGPYLFPGWYFALPTLGALLILAASGYLALWRICRTPTAAWPELRPADRALRRNAGSLVGLVVLAAVLLTGAQFLVGAGTPLLNAPVLDTGLAAGAAGALSVVGIVTVVLGAAVLVTGLVVAVIAVLAAVRVARLGSAVVA